MFATTAYRSLYFSGLIAQLLYAGAISIKGTVIILHIFILMCLFSGLWSSQVAGQSCDISSSSLCRELGYSFCLLYISLLKCWDFSYQKFCQAFVTYPKNKAPLCSYNATLDLFSNSTIVPIPPHTDYMVSNVFQVGKVCILVLTDTAL